MPIIDETEFKTEISKIVGPEEYDETDVELTVEKRLDFAYLGILLTILRLTYLSLFLNRNGVNEDNLNTTDPSEEAQELKYLLSNPINITVTDVAQECLEQFDFLRKTNFTVLQCTFLLRLYCMFAPEDGDGADVGDSQTYNAMLIQMAYSMGINREPTTNISHGQWDILTDDLKMNNVQRKIWFFLVICDLIQGYKFGNPLCIDKNITIQHYHFINQEMKIFKMWKWKNMSLVLSHILKGIMKNLLLFLIPLWISRKILNYRN